MRRLQGFTLVEMVLVIIVVGMLSVTLGMALFHGVGAFRDGREVVDTLSALRLSGERLAREIRTVRRDTITPTNYDFLARSATGLSFRRLENDGVTVTTVTVTATPPNLTITYSSVAGTHSLTQQLNALTFSYYRADGVTPASAHPVNSDIAFVEFDLSLTDPFGNSYPQRTRVALRNRQ